MTEKNQQDSNLSEFVHEYDVGLAREEGIPLRLLNAQTLSIRKAAERDKAAAKLNALKVQRKGLQDRKAALEAIPADTTKTLWCADYTDDLSGVVGTAEVPGEGQEKVIILPADLESAAYNAERDGQLFFREGMTGPQAYYNAAILPGWQRHMPTFRVGAITAIDEALSTCSVSLDSVTSSAYSLPINAAASLNNVPIEYMDCDAEAFEVGDRVLVKFVGNSWASPKVIGFESNPKECPLDWPDVVLPIIATFANTQAATGSISNGNVTWEPCSPGGRFRWSGSTTQATGAQTTTYMYLSGNADTLRQDDLGTADQYWKLSGTWYKWDSAADPKEWVIAATADIPETQLAIESTVHGIANAFLAEINNLFQSTGTKEHLYSVTGTTETPSSLEFVFRRWDYPAIQSIGLPDAECDAPAAIITPSSDNVLWGKQGWSGAGATRNPPGYTLAANPPYDLGESGPALQPYKEVVEETLLIKSSAPATVSAWLLAEGIPATLTMSQMVDDVKREKVYQFKGAELRPLDSLGAGNLVRWAAVYEPQP